ncbi:AAA family ATPase [Flavobacterium sp. PL002]|uniref:AAA family ATPase n=1 Tax=Flavobacterium sp. PL002 TaxID=1897058 RepID=UPI00178879BD|nr:ATP-binding protein [Flavobacterium sp. PL002]MBE0391973.1 hypothetical protein [Flavobacterium sp. PL002]
MKLSKLHIEEYRHLENLYFDFTYPADYKDKTKAGKPLDKICFIGQSATGKTGLLELIYNLSNSLLSVHVANNRSLSLPIKSDYSSELYGEILFTINDNIINQKHKEVTYKNQKYFFENFSGTLDSLVPESDKKNIYYFKSNIISDKNIDIFTKNPIDLNEKHNEDLLLLAVHFHSKNSYGNTFNDNVDEKIWLYLISEILEYRKNFTQKMSELIHKGLLSNPSKLDSEYKKWQKENPNELEDFAKKFNPIIEKLNLEVDLVNTEYSIPIKNKKTDEVIPIQNTSTGTKGLLLSFLPLFKLDTKDSIILIDEPERSLYPDMQMDLMDHYQNLAPEAQFIVATHSPFIAASFEPEERFILYFDEEGKVAIRSGKSPIGDDPNDMLKNDFAVNYYNKYGEAAYKQYLNLKEQITKENDPNKKKKLLLETVKLGDTYNF